MWPLGLLFLLPPLSPCSGCVFCKQPYWHLQDRFYNLCEAYKAAESSDNCTQYPGPYSFNPYGIDEGDLIFITHKTHRVFRMLEITNDTLGIAAYWDWLHEVKLVEYSHKALCPPLCKEAAHVYNCTLCQMESMECWSEHTCYPETVYLDDAVVIVEYCGLLCMLLGAIVFSCEYHWQRKRERRAADRDAL